MKSSPTSRRKALKLLGLGATSALGLSAFSFPHISSLRRKEKLGVALVGLGYYSRDVLAPALQLTQHCELKGIVTGTPAKIPKWQEKYGITDKNVYNYENMHTIADNPDIDVIYVVLPTGLHSKYSVIAAEAGKHVWCEKPMARTAAECQAIIDACKENKVKLTIGYRMHHEPNTQVIMAYAKQKPYGKITSVKAEAAYRDSRTTHWKQNKALGGGAMYDMGVYPLNAMRYATGMEPIKVLKASHSTNRPEVYTEVDDTTRFTLEFPGGLIAEGLTSFDMSVNQLHIKCQNGSYGLSPFSSYNGVKGSTSDGKTIHRLIDNQQAKQMDDDALAIKADRQVLVPGEEGLRDIRIVEAIYRSAAEKKAISLI